MTAESSVRERDATMFYDIVEAHCYVVTTGKWILMSIYVAESIHRWRLMIAECFEPLSTAYNLMKAYVTETFLID